MYILHHGVPRNYGNNLVHGLLREALLEQFTEGFAYDFGGGHEYHHTDNHGGYGVKHRPLAAEEDGGAYADGSAYGRERVTAVMPGIGGEGWRLEKASLTDGELIGPLFHGYAHKGGDKRDKLGLLKLFTIDGT